MRLRSLALLACAVGVCAQTPSFDVASVKPVPFDARTFNGMRHTATPTSLTMRHVSLGYIVRLAYGIPVERGYELIGPDWFNPPGESQFDVIAKTAEPVSEAQLKLMLRTLLAERFQLAVHSEKRMLPVYELVLLKESPALHPAAGREATVKWMDDHVDSFRAFSMTRLAVYLGPPHTSRPVVDRTGLTGSFDFQLDLSRYILDPETGKPIHHARGAIDEEGALVRGLREQLGLALKPGRAPIDVLVVDHVLKVPAGN